MCSKLKLVGLATLLSAAVLPSQLSAQQLTRSDIGNLLNENVLQASQNSRRGNDRGRDNDRDRGRNNRRSEFRTMDGTDNNDSRRRSDWGASGTTYAREISANYASSDPNNALNDEGRPSPRAISNLICDEPVTQFNTLGLNTMLYVWGQFIDHDMTSNAKAEAELAPIPLPEDEETFTEDISFTRSGFEMVNGTREQINLNTAFLDGSVVYGSDDARAEWLRTFDDGKLKTSEGDNLPFNTLTGEYDSDIDPEAPSMDGDGGKTIKIFVAGDDRASENTILTSMQTVFLREHNRICDELVADGETNDEKIYQIARKHVGAYIASITYEEFLPALGLNLKSYRGYDDDVRPDILNTFAAAAYRFGHTQVSDDVVVVDNECEEVGPGEFELLDTFFTPDLYLEYGPEIFLKGATVHRLYKTDTKINDVLRDFLFGDPSSPVRFGVDLGSLNIQRGRDHGLPDYNTARRFYTGSRAEQFADISTNDTVAQNLEVLYNDINKIDLWVGLLSETVDPAKTFGPTITAMLNNQFENLRDGDYYYYENDPFFSRREVRRIKNTTLTDVIERNTTLTSLFDDAFELDYCFGDGVGVPLTTSAKSINTEYGVTPLVYPTAIDNALNVEFFEAYESGFVEIYSLNGSLVKTVELQDYQQKIQLNMDDLAAGVYLIKLQTKNAPLLSIQKVIKQ